MKYKWIAQEVAAWLLCVAVVGLLVHMLAEALDKGTTL